MRAAGPARTPFTWPAWDGPGTGPHPVSQEELRAAFHPGTGWTVVAIEPDRVQTRYHDEDGAPAWFATIKRV
jgi:hypothetical protein